MDENQSTETNEESQAEERQSMSTDIEITSEYSKCLFELDTILSESNRILGALKGNSSDVPVLIPDINGRISSELSEDDFSSVGCPEEGQSDMGVSQDHLAGFLENSIEQNGNIVVKCIHI